MIFLLRNPLDGVAQEKSHKARYETCRSAIFSSLPKKHLKDEPRGKNEQS